VPVIYDFGANNGLNVPYYLSKAEKVVAVDANPVLADQMRERFKEAIASGRLIVENCVLIAGEQAPEVPFWLHKTIDVKSQFPTPTERPEDYERIILPAKRALDIIRAHGEPHYVKIDIEYYDHVILRDLMANKIRPPYVSAECQSVKCFCLLVAAGYGAFKLVDGSSVHERYARHEVQTTQGKRLYAFPPHAAGPFGNDIRGPWMTDDNLFRVLAYAGLGWKDVHASRVDPPDPKHQPRPRVTIDF